MRIASIFSGAMGLDIGLERQGCQTVIAVEKDKHAVATIHANRPDIPVIEDAFDPTLSQKIIDAKVDAIVGGPPCQSWSYAGNHGGMDDHRGLCIPRFLDLVEAVRPQFVAMENVMGLLSAEIDGEKGAVVRMVTERLITLGYYSYVEQANSADYGASQCRKRIVVLAKLNGPCIRLPNQSHSNEPSIWGLPKWKTLKDAIGDRPKGDCAKYPENKIQYFRLLKEGQDWRDLPAELQSKAMGGAFHSSGGRTSYFRRLSWNKPSPTLMCCPTQNSTSLCHPDEDRPLNVVEYARIQGFPDNWIFKGPLAARYKQIGNAVPVQLGEAIGKALHDSTK